MRESSLARRRLTIAVLAAAIGIALLATASSALGCSVCWGDSDSPMAAGVNMGIFVLLGVTCFVLAGFVLLILTIRSRTRKYEARRAALQVVDFVHEPARD